MPSSTHCPPRCSSLVLLAAPLAHADDDVDPEPAGAANAGLRAIKGKWVAVKVLGGAREREARG